MRRVLVIADDLTGAAEVAAGAVAYGLRASIQTAIGSDDISDVVVINTDTRDCDAVEAVRRVQDICASVDVARFDLTYKKTDSVCRGHVRNELRAVIRSFDRPRAVFVPANPSKQRTVRDGIYRIAGIDLHLTEFGRAHASVANVRELIGLTPDDRAIETPDAGSAAEIAALAEKLHADVLPAGGIDFFLALLAYRFGITQPEPKSVAVPSGMRLFVCGTRSVSRAHLLESAARATVPVVIAEVANIGAVRRLCQAHLEVRRRCVLISPEAGVGIALSGTDVEQSLAAVASRLAESLPLSLLCMEGGAVASAVLRAWKPEGSAQAMALDVAGEVTPGVVVLNVRRIDGIQNERPTPSLVIKPGSYRWPESIFN